MQHGTPNAKLIHHKMDSLPVIEEIPVISASDIERYSYCPLSWWLGVKGDEGAGEELRKGEKAHEKVGRDLSTIQSKERETRNFETIVMWFAVV